MKTRRKALIIMGYTNSLQTLPAQKKQESGWGLGMRDDSLEHVSRGDIVSPDFLLVREKKDKRKGFIEVELQTGESPMSAIRRLNHFSEAAIVKPWESVDEFTYDGWEVQVGVIYVHHHQRSVELFEASDELPLIVEWLIPQALYRQQEDDLLNLLTSTALSHQRVRAFLLATQRQEAA